MKVPTCKPTVNYLFFCAIIKWIIYYIITYLLLVFLATFCLLKKRDRTFMSKSSLLCFYNWTSYQGKTPESDHEYNSAVQQCQNKQNAGEEDGRSWNATLRHRGVKSSQMKSILSPLQTKERPSRDSGACVKDVWARSEPQLAARGSARGVCGWLGSFNCCQSKVFAFRAARSTLRM